MERDPLTGQIQSENGDVSPAENADQKKTLTEALHEQLGVKLPSEQEVPPAVQTPQVPKIEKISFVDVTQLAESEARDAAEEHLTARKENLKGIKGWWKKVWDYNILREYNRQKEIAKVKGEIYKDGNIYAGVDEDEKHHKAAMAAITQRFLSEYDVVREDSGEVRKNLDEISDTEAAEKEVLKEEVKKMIMDYATAENPSDAAFDAARYRVLEKVTKLGKGVVEEGKMYADNLRTVAEQVRMSLAHNKGLQELDFELDISLGRATSGVRTEANYNKVDKIIQKIQKTKVGSTLVSETGIASAVAIAASVAPRMAVGTARRAAKLFGLGAAVSGVVAGAKENKRLKLERAQHARGMAKGGSIEKGSDRREEMEEYRYKTVPAEALRSELLSQIYVEGNPEKGMAAIEPAQFEDVLKTMAQIEGRINLSNKNGIDLISYSDITKVEIERTNLEIDLARAKVALKKLYESNVVLQGDRGNKNFNDMLKDNTGAFEEQTKKLEIKEKDRKFAWMKAKGVGAAMVKGAVNSMIVGGVVGAVGQEIRSAFDPKLEGVVEHYVSGHSHTATHNTMLEQLRGYIFGNPHENVSDARLTNVEGWHDPHEHIQFPEGTKVIEGDNDTVTIIDPSGKTVAENIPFKFNGTDLTDETRKALEEHHISFISAESHNVDGGTTTIETSPDEYAENHPGDLHTIKRDLWYDNDTAKPIFDKNELGTHWGGLNGTGINEEGKYVLNIEHMSKDGSYHGDFSADAKELMKNGGLKMLFSMSQDTQHQVFEIPIDEHGNAVIDPDSEAGKLLFKTVDGKAEFLGRFAEVGQNMPGDDAEHFRILSTVEGHGIDKVPDVTPTTDIDTIRRFTFETDEAPRDWNLPPAIPLMGRTPLEPLGRVKPKEQVPEQSRPIQQEVPPAPVVETPVETPVVEPQKESPVVEYGEMHAEEENVQKGGEEIPKGSFRPERSPEANAISQEEYDALRDDINLINKKVQANEGIVTVDENSFKSQFAKDLYNGLKNIKPGIPVQFNKTELREMGDKIEKRLMESKIDRSLDKLMLTPEEYEDLVDDINFINKKVQANEGIVTVNEGDFFSAFGKRKYNEMKSIKPGIPVQFNKTELREMGDMIEKRILANSKVARTARDIELMRSQRGMSLDQVPVREEKAPEQPKQNPVQENIPPVQPVVETIQSVSGTQPEQNPNPTVILAEEPVIEKMEPEVVVEEKEKEPELQPVPAPEIKTEKKDDGMVYQEYAKKYTVNENFIGVANAKETNNPAEAILTFDPATKRALPYKEGWEALLRSTKGDPFFLERALRPFFNYNLKGNDFGTHFEKLRFTPAEIDPVTGMVIKKGEIKIFDDGSPLIKTPISNN